MYYSEGNAVNEGKEMVQMLPTGMEVLNIEYQNEDREQIYGIGWITKISMLKELSRYGTI